MSALSPPVFDNAIRHQATVFVQVPILGAFEKLRKATISFMSVRLSARKNSAPTEQTLTKFFDSMFFENMFRKFKVRENLTRITGTLHVHQYTFLWSHRFQFFLQ